MGKTPTFVSSLSQEHNNQSGDNDFCKWGLAAFQGWRYYMEDAHVAFVTEVSGEKVFVMGVFDGHGGWHVSNWLERDF